MTDPQIPTRTFKTTSSTLSEVGGGAAVFMIVLAPLAWWMISMGNTSAVIAMYGSILFLVGVSLIGARREATEITVSAEGVQLKTLWGAKNFSWAEVQDVDLGFNSYRGHYAPTWSFIELRTKEGSYIVSSHLDDSEELLTVLENKFNKKLERDSKLWLEARKKRIKSLPYHDEPD